MKPKRVLGILLTLALAFGLLGTAASAADVNIQATLPSFVLGTTSATPTKVGFGGKQWAVIGYNGAGVASQAGKLTLLLANDQSYGSSAFDASSPYSNEYLGSDLKATMEAAFTGLTNNKEKALVAGRDLAGGGVNYGVTGYDADKIAGPNVTDAKFWPLSTNEANAVNSTVRTTDPWWWLRSPGRNQNYAATVDNGNIYFNGGPVNYDIGGVRPALWLNLASVLFVSDASGASAKSAATVGSTLQAARAVGGTVKFTMKDTSLALGGVTATSRSGNTLNFTYSGATTGKTLSAVVLGSDGAVKYYGKLVASTSASGTASITLPTGLLATDTVQIFVEEANADNLTDFASEYKQLGPALTSGSVNRTSDTAATIGFTASHEGAAYYYVAGSGDGAPTASFVKNNGTSLGAVTAGAISGRAVTLSAGAKDIYVVLEALGGLLSAPLKISVAAFGGGGGTDPGANYIKLWGKTTKYLSNFGNWLLVIFCFGWIWMAF